MISVNVKEAVSRLEGIMGMNAERAYTADIILDNTAIRAGISALYYRIPMRVKDGGYCANCGRRLRGDISPHNILSGKRVCRRGDKYCPRCGQAVDWGDEEG